MCIDAFSAPLTRLGLLSLLGILVLGLSIVAVPALLDGDDTTSPSQDAATTTTEDSVDAEPAESEDDPADAPSALLATARISSDGIVLDGVVNTEGQRDVLVDAARRRVGPAKVEDNLQIATGLRTSEGRDNGVVALQTFLAKVPDGVIVAATSAEGRLEVSGEAESEQSAQALQVALEAAVAAAPGTELRNDVEVPPPPPPTAEELAAAAQLELDQLNELLRTEVLFATSSNEPTEEFTALLDQLPAILTRHPSVTVEIIGHTDDRGSAEGNQKLSDERATAALDYLVGLGADPARLTARGAGESEPIDTNTTRDGRAANRRVELRAS